MVQDHQKISKKEATGLVMAGVGFALISSMISPYLNVDIQKDLVHAVKIFDLSESYQQPAEAMVFVWDTNEKFLDEVYIAFNQVAVSPQEQTQAPSKLVGNILKLSDSLAAGFNKNNLAYEVNADRVGQVLGEFIELRIKNLR